MVSNNEVADEAEGKTAPTRFGTIGNLRDGGTTNKMDCLSIGLEYILTADIMIPMWKRSWLRTSMA